ncbi:DUF4127 family protein [Fictibacillus arsenicus]|uniref:DUF4127 family protein n=1 Tax=Fictibacillus arsenicus TaxID=255247 RepID=UPI001558705B|nr:DUF4127 family protein [Fictibacillus arsenicus]
MKNKNLWKVFVIILFLLTMLLFIIRPNAIPKIDSLFYSEPSILVIPLDDRPVNTYIPSKIGQIKNLKLSFIPDNMYRNPDKLLTWLEQEGVKKDEWVLSLDQVLYGGLVESRILNEDTLLAKKRLERLTKIKEEHPEIKIYAFSSQLRLAPTAFVSDDLDYYTNLRKWGILTDKVNRLHETSLIEELEKVEDSLGEQEINKYQRLRGKRLSVQLEAIHDTKKGVYESLWIGQDDASSVGIHVMERHRLIKETEEINATNITFFSGIDEATSLLVTAITSKKKGNEEKLLIHPIYTNPQEKNQYMPFSSETLEETVNNHVKMGKGNVSKNLEGSQLVLIINTPNTSDVQRDFVIKQVNNLIKKGKNVMVADVAIANKADEKFVKALIKNIPVPSLSSFSAWNTADNTIGLSLAHGIARFETKYNKGISQDQFFSHEELLFRSFLKDYIYKTKLYPTMESMAINQGYDPLSLMNGTEIMEEWLSEEIGVESEKLWLTEFKGYKDQNYKLNNLQSIKTALPWARLFEAQIDPKIE